MKTRTYIRCAMCVFLLMFVTLAPSSVLAQKGKKGKKNGIGSERGLTEDKYLDFIYKYHEGLKFQMLGDYKQSIDLFNACVKIDPNSAASRYQLATMFAQLNDLDGARVNAQKAASINKNNFWYQMLLGDILLKQGDTDKGLEAYDRAIALQPNNTDLLFNYANILLLKGKYEKALDVLDKVEKITGLTEDLGLMRHDVLMRSREFQKAANELERLIIAFPKEVKYKGMLAEMYLQMNQTNRALGLYRDIVARNPNDGLAAISLANYYANRDQTDSVFYYLHRAFCSDLDYKTKVSVFVSPVSLVLDNPKNSANTRILMDTLISIEPQGAEIRAIYAGYLLKEGKKREARDQLHQYIKLDQSQVEVWSQLISLDMEIADYENMYNDSRQALELYPEQAMMYLYKGTAAYFTKKYDEAIETLNNGLMYVIENKRLESQFYLYIGESYHAQQKHSQSDAAFETMMQADPDNIAGANNYAYYLAQRKQNLVRAQQLSTACINAQPTSPSLLDTHAWVLFQSEQYTEALTYIEKAIQSGGSNNATIIEHYGDILFRLGKTDEALAQWQKALQAGGDSTKLNNKIQNKKLE